MGAAQPAGAPAKNIRKHNRNQRTALRAGSASPELPQTDLGTAKRSMATTNDPPEDACGFSSTLRFLKKIIGQKYGGLNDMIQDIQEIWEM